MHRKRKRIGSRNVLQPAWERLNRIYRSAGEKQKRVQNPERRTRNQWISTRTISRNIIALNAIEVRKIIRANPRTCLGFGKCSLTPAISEPIKVMTRPDDYRLDCPGGI